MTHDHYEDDVKRITGELDLYAAGAACAGNGRAASVFSEASYLLTLCYGALKPVLNVDASQDELTCASACMGAVADALRAWRTGAETGETKGKGK